MEHGLPQPSDVIAGKYTVERALGRGGMGAVYVVSHRLTGKRLALKCLLPEFIHNADIVERFLREAQATGRIEHRNVVNVFDVGRDGEILYIVMELLDGKPLSDLLHDEALTLEETLAIVVRAMEGVAAAHAHNIVHRDLKPDNIFVCRGASGRLDDPRVLDFGISKLDDGDGMRLTRSGVAMGTPYYMSLEQLSGQRDLDQRVDVYAMGVILYEAIAGVPPHTADSVAALAIRVLTVPPVPLNSLRPDLPPGLGEVVMKAIAKDRGDRYPNMQALIDAVRPFIPRGAGLLVPEGQGRPLRTPRGATPLSNSTVERTDQVARTPAVGAPVATTPPTGGPLTSANHSRTRALLLGAVAAFVLLVGGTAWLMRSRSASIAAPASLPPPHVPALPPAAELPRNTATVSVPAEQTSAPPPAAALPAPSAHEQIAPAPAPEADSTPVQHGKGKGHHRGKTSAATEPAPASATAPVPAPSPRDPAQNTSKTAQGRAGKLGSDDF